MKIGIVNYSLGNVGSIYSALKFYNYDVCMTDTPQQLSEVDVIILAGVGNFKTAVERLKAYGFWDALNREVLEKKKPVLGICLGMQLFSDVSFEDGKTPGFGWISGEVKKISGQNLRLPHMGWNEVTPRNGGSKLFKGIIDNFFYFMHSYQFIAKSPEVVMASARYGDVEVASMIKKDNITGVQFHPEKSQGDGLRFLKNFVEALQ